MVFRVSSVSGFQPNVGYMVIVQQPCPAILADTFDTRNNWPSSDIVESRLSHPRGDGAHVMMYRALGEREMSPMPRIHSQRPDSSHCRRSFAARATEGMRQLPTFVVGAPCSRSRHISDLVPAAEKTRSWTSGVRDATAPRSRPHPIKVACPATRSHIYSQAYRHRNSWLGQRSHAA